MKKDPPPFPGDGEDKIKSMEKVVDGYRQKWAKSLVSTLTSDGRIIEMIYDPITAHTAFSVWQDGKTNELSEVTVAGVTYRPYSAHNNLVKNEIVLFPETPVDYSAESELTAELSQFICRYIDLDPLFAEVAVHYVLLSWVYDAFNELPYLRVRGDYGSGKTRFLLTVGSLCYKPIFASGASTVSPLFRLLDTFRGTLVVDEGDFRFSDERTELVKILNNGSARGFPVLRSELMPSKEFNPSAYAVFGPKLIAMRSAFDDPALESRLISEELGLRPVRAEIPINLPNTHREEARQLRNKLLMFRFRNRHNIRIVESLVQASLEPRYNQIFVPLLSVIGDPSVQRRVMGIAHEYQANAIAERGNAPEGQILAIIRDLLASGETQISVKTVTNWFADRHGEDYERKITGKWIGSILRRKLYLRTRKSHGGYVISLPGNEVLQRLYGRYGFDGDDDP